MKKTFIKRTIDDLVKAVETKYGKKCEVMTLTLKTQMDPSGSLFVHAEAIVDFDGDEHSYQVSRDFDL